MDLDEFKRVEIHRPQFPLVLKWIDLEFHVIYINLDAAENANIISLVEDDPDEDEPQDEE